MVRESAICAGSSTPPISTGMDLVNLPFGRDANACAHGTLGTRDDLVCDCPQVLELMIGGDAGQGFGADPARRKLGTNVTHDLFAESDIARENGKQVLVGPSRAMQPHQRDQQPFLEHLLAEARALATADIDVMHAVNRVADDAIAMERGCKDEDVGGLAVADPWVVADKDITGTGRLRTGKP